MNTKAIIFIVFLLFIVIWAAVVWAVYYHVFKYRFPEDHLGESFWVFVVVTTPALLFLIVNLINVLAEVS